MPKDRVTQQHQGYGFVEFMGEEDADYGIKIMNMIKVCIICVCVKENGLVETSKMKESLQNIIKNVYCIGIFDVVFHDL